MKTILLTDGEFTGMIRTLRSLEEEVRIIGFVSSHLCAHITMLDKFYIAPASGTDKYLDFIIETARKENVDLIFPVVTTSLEFIAGHQERIYKESGAKVIISSERSVRIANNKALLYDFFSSTDLNSIITPYYRAATLSELRFAVNAFTDQGIDCISKPVRGENAEGFIRFTDNKTYLSETLTGTGSRLMSIDALGCQGSDITLPDERLVMPYLPGKEWDVDILSINGNLIAATVRQNHDMFGGLSACTTTASNDLLIDYCSRIVKMLNLDYLSCISFREDSDGNPKLLEINPRAMGSINLSSICGNNLVQQLLDIQELTETSGCRITAPGITASLYYDLTIVEPKPVIWNTISPPDQHIYKKYYNMISSRITDIVFNCRFAWDIMYHFKWAIIEDCLVQISFGTHFSNPFMLTPLGEFDSEKLSRIVSVVKREFDQRGLDFTIYGIDEAYKDIFEQINVPHGPVYYNDDFSDYLYSAERLRTLAGRNYSKKRNHLHKFENTYLGYVYESLNPSHFEECLQLTKAWEQKKGIEPANMEDSDYLIIRNLLSNWERLDCRGGVIKIDGHIQAFSIGSLEKDTAYIHFEKANAEIEGIYAAINQYVLKNEFADAEYVNREEDMGIEGLRQAKRSYFPIEMVRKYKMDIL